MGEAEAESLSLHSSDTSSLSTLMKSSTFMVILIGAIAVGAYYLPPVQRVVHPPGPSNPVERADLAKYFSTDYLEARRRLVEACEGINGCIHIKLDVPEPGLRGKEDVEDPVPDLSIDVAWIGPKNPEKVLIVSSGVHGVEGFSGSAIQLYALKHMEICSPKLAFVLIHAVNAYGMCRGRRFNAANVDLNRNNLGEGGVWSGEPNGYMNVKDMLEPATSLHRTKVQFIIDAVSRIVRHGKAVLVEAVASGQREHSNGLFYGGKAPEPEVKAVNSFVKEYIVKNTTTEVMWIDLHTGLGKYGEFELLSHATDDDDDDRIAKIFGSNRYKKQRNSDSAVKYTSSGLLVERICEILNQYGIRMTPIIAEFGTYWDIDVLYALIEENRCHILGGDECGVQGHWKQYMKEVFAPEIDVWRAAVVKGGIGILENGLKSLN